MGCDFFWPDICVYEHCGAKFFFGMFVFYFAGVCMYVFVVVYTKIYQCPGIVTDQYSRHIHLRYMDIGLRIVCICVFVCNIFFIYHHYLVSPFHFPFLVYSGSIGLYVCLPVYCFSYKNYRIRLAIVVVVIVEVVFILFIIIIIIENNRIK